MVLEATMLVLDNSEWMRNGDYTPSRLEAQSDAATLLFNAKTQSNPENTVGLMTMAGKSGPEVHVTLTADIGKILSAIHKVKISGSVNVSTGVQIAQLALKHRQNKNQKQRIIVFVGSPLAEDKETLEKLGKKLKKNKVAIDIVNFGEEAENSEKLEAFIQAVNSSDNSHLVTIPPGPHILSDLLISSPIIQGEDGAGAAFAGAGGFEFGVDPNLDPELILALRISMEEERARQETLAGPKPSAVAMETDQPQQSASNDEDELLAQALALSMNPKADEDVAMEDLSEEEQMRRALEMSMSDGNEASSHPSILNNPEFLQNVLGNLPGVNPNDPRLKDAGKKKDDEKK